MAESEVKRAGGSTRAMELSAMALPLCVLALWWAPRAATPTEVPALVLPRAAVRTALLDDEALAARAPTSEAETRRRDLYLEQGRAEIRADDSVASATGRAEALIHALAAVAEEGGEDAVAAVRMADVLRIEAALRGVGPPGARAGEAGVFMTTLERWGATEEGRRIAPPIVVRALAIARWNAVFTRPLTEGMGPLHLRAYHGWLAFHGAVGWTELRERALEAYSTAGGGRALETRGVLLVRAGEPLAAREAFEDAYERVGSLRLRNLALGAIEAGASD